MEVLLQIQSVEWCLFLKSVFDPRELLSGYLVLVYNPPVTDLVLRSGQRVDEWLGWDGCENRLVSLRHQREAGEISPR